MRKGVMIQPIGVPYDGELVIEERTERVPPEHADRFRRSDRPKPMDRPTAATFRVLVLGLEPERVRDSFGDSSPEVEVLSACTAAEARQALDARLDGLLLHVTSGTGMFLARLVRELPVCGVPTVALVDGAVYGGCALELGADVVVALRPGESAPTAGARAIRVCRSLAGEPAPASTQGRGYALLLETHRKLLAQTVEGRLGRAMVVHDLRSPLGILRGVHAEVVDRGLGAQVGGIMQRSIEQLSSLVDRLEALDTSDPLRPERMDLAEVARGVVEQLRLDPASRDRTLTAVCAEGISWTGDRRLVERILMNLITNALRHANGHVEVRVDPCPAGGVRMAVIDDGPGIPETIRTELFRRYVRSPQGGRLGLGLAIVKTAVERFDGRVAAYDRADLGAAGTTGACFVVRLPRS